MISQEQFIKKCEGELLSNRELSKETLLLVEDLSKKDKVLLKPILDFINRFQKPIQLKFEKNKFEFSPKERVSACRLIFLTMSLDTKSPAWSSYMLTQAIQAAVSINGLNISEIGIAVLEIFCEYKTPLNRFVYNFCMDFTKEFVIHHKDRLNELRVLNNWGNLCSQNNASVSLLRAWLCRDDKPEFVLKTFMGLLENEYFKDFKNENKYLFEDAEYKKDFIKHLANAELSDINKSMILSEI